MTSIRAMVHVNRELAALLLAAALLLRIFVPAGFMPALDHGRMIVGVCNGMGVSKMVIETPGFEHKSQGNEAQKSCAFSDLSLPSLAGANPILLAALVLFILALGLSFSIPLPPTATIRLRPPVRGPPQLS